jgi:transposase
VAKQNARSEATEGFCRLQSTAVIEKDNRRSQSEFLCLNCGHTAHADVNASLNIAFWASVNAPIVSDAPAIIIASVAAAGSAPETSYSALAVVVS